MIEQLQHANANAGASGSPTTGAPTTSGGQSTEEMTATEEERLKHAPAAPALAAAAHSFGSSGEACPLIQLPSTALILHHQEASPSACNLAHLVCFK